MNKGKMESKKKKALIVASVASMLDQFNKENIEILEDFGFTVEVAANFEKGSITSKKRVKEYKKELEENGIKAYHVPIPRKTTDIPNLIKSYKLLKSIIDTGKYDIIHCHSPIGGVLCRLAARKAGKQGTKIVYTAHGFHFYDGAPIFMWLLFYPIEKWCSWYTDVLITMNREDYRRSQSFHAGRTAYVSGIGVHTNEIQIVKEDRDSLRNALGLKKDDFVFISVGQLSKRKNQETVIKAMAEISDPHIKYLIVGLGELHKTFYKMIKELGLQERIILTGYREDISDLLHASDILVLPSKQEGLPVALMEAMSAGLPVICSRIRGNIDLIKDGEGGYLCNPGDPHDFALKMRKLSKDKETMKRMGKVNLETMKRFDKDVVRKQMTEIYKSIM